MGGAALGFRRRPALALPGGRNEVAERPRAAWIVLRFTVIPRSFRWTRIFALTAPQEGNAPQNARREIDERRREARDYLREQSRDDIKRFQKQAGLAHDGIVGPRTIEAARRIGKARHAHQKHADRLGL